MLAFLFILSCGASFAFALLTVIGMSSDRPLDRKLTRVCFRGALVSSSVVFLILWQIGALKAL